MSDEMAALGCVLAVILLCGFITFRNVDATDRYMRQTDHEADHVCRTTGDKLTAVREQRDAAEAALTREGLHYDADHGWHRPEPGIDTDMIAEGRSPDPRWCNVCGSNLAAAVAAQPKAGTDD